MNRDHCGTCRFFLPEFGNPTDSGDCRRHSPAITKEHGRAAFPAVWPEVEGSSDWCGDHQPIPAKPATAEEIAAGGTIQIPLGTYAVEWCGKSMPGGKYQCGRVRGHDGPCSMTIEKTF